MDIGYASPCVTYNATLNINGSAQLNGVAITSDSTLKTNVNPIGNALPLLKQFKGVSFHYVPSVVNDSLTAGQHYGFIAQQVERILPRLVYTNPNGIKALAYTEIIPWVVKGMQEQLQIANHDSIVQKQTNDSLRYTLDSLRSAFKSILACLAIVCPTPGDAPVRNNGRNGNNGDNNANGNAQDVMLSANANAPLLYQNVPNPFSTGTKINYYLPVGTQGATMLFYDTYGNQLKTVELSQTGNGTLNITPDNLSAGIYSYSLVVNGNVIDTKRMLLQK